MLRLLPSTVRSYTYDRTAYGGFEISPRAPTAENIALESLIEGKGIRNPLVLVRHSWASVLVRELVVLCGYAGDEGKRGTGL